MITTNASNGTVPTGTAAAFAQDSRQTEVALRKFRDCSPRLCLGDSGCAFLSSGMTKAASYDKLSIVHQSHDEEISGVVQETHIPSNRSPKGRGRGDLLYLVARSGVCCFWLQSGGIEPVV